MTISSFVRNINKLKVWLPPHPKRFSYLKRYYSQAPKLNSKGGPVEHLNIGTIGHVDHGKTTLTSAITKVLAKSGGARYTTYDSIDRAPEEKLRGITINASHIEYSTEKRHYAHTDCPGHADFIKNTICGTSRMDGAILVVAADDGCMPQTREHLLVCRQVGVSKILPFINKADIADNEVLDLIELEIRDLLEDFGFPDHNSCPVIKGSALKALQDSTTSDRYGEAAIRELLNAMDEYFCVPHRDVISPLLAPVESALNVRGRGTVVICTLQRGVLHKGDKIDLVGFDELRTCVVTEIQMFGRSVESCSAGDHVGILVRGIKTTDVARGVTLAAHKSLEAHNRYKANMYLLARGEGGRSKPISKRYIMPMFSQTWNVPCRVDVVGDNSLLMPGDHGEVELTLAKKMVMLTGQNFSIREHGKTVATGIIVDTLPDVKIVHTQLGKVALK